jgi:TetR/AcrR family transcriptional repressor of lmrAB and yxaGH operons
MTNAASKRSLSTKDRLIQSAALLFRRRGYHAVGLSDLLAQANAPKGSLYHHFPNGKTDLAIAAATWAGDEMLRIIAASFEDARDFKDGFATLCFKLAKLFDLSELSDGCPVSNTLLDGPNNQAFRDVARQILDGWIAEAETYAIRFGSPPDEAKRKAELFLMLLEGGWIMARARQSSDVLRALPTMLQD